MRIKIPTILFLALWMQAITAVGITRKQESELLEKAAAWSVPQPDKDARLYQSWAYGGETDFFLLVFINPKKPKEYLLGLHTSPLKQGVKYHLVPDINKLSLKNITATSSFEASMDYNYGLVTGIQLIRAGYRTKGLALINHSLGKDAGHSHSPFRSPPKEAPTKMLARACLAHAYNSITTAKPDFKAIHDSVQKVLHDQPNLKTKSTDWLLNSLKKNLAHILPPDGSIEALIDDFLLAQKTHGIFSASSLKGKSQAEVALVLKGFKAIPALLKQRNAERFSNHLMQGFNNFVSHPMTAGQAINAYLQNFANSEFDSDWVKQQQGYTSSDQAVKDWWKKASAMGEEAYVKKYLVTTITKNGEKEQRESEHLLQIAAARYPDLLVWHYEKALGTDMQTHSLIRAIVAHDKFSKNKKIALLQKGIVTNREAHRNNSLRHMFDLHPDLATKHLIRFLKIAPSTTKTEYCLDQDARLTEFVSKSTSPEVWSQFHRYLSRADLGMRMELIDGLKPPRDSPPHVLHSFFKVYDRYKNTTVVRRTWKSKKFEGPCAGFMHDNFSVANFIHLHWKRWLELDLKSPERDSSYKTWLAFRREVAAKVKAAR